MLGSNFYWHGTTEEDYTGLCPVLLAHGGHELPRHVVTQIIQVGGKGTACALKVQPRTIRAHTQTLKKKALQAHQQIRNSLRMCPHVLFFGAIRYARCSFARFG